MELFLVGIFFFAIIVCGIFLYHPKKFHEKKHHVRYRCVECGVRLSFDEMMGSHGVCPYCGHVDEGTVCDVITDSVFE